MQRRVGIVGTGNMGGGMAAHLIEQGWAVQVHDIDRAKVDGLHAMGAIACADAQEAASGCPALIVCVVDAGQTDVALFGEGGAIGNLRPGQAVLLCPTIAPGDVERLSRQLAQHGVDAIDAPMSGGPARARDGSMSLIVACAGEVFECHRELVEALSSKVFHVSEQPGDGARTKLVNNLLAGINLVGAAEAMALAQRMGLDLSTTLGVIEQSSGQSWIGTDRMRRAIQGDYEPRAHMTLLQKDTRLAMEAAACVGFEGPLGAAARDVFARAAQAGLANLDDAALYQLLCGTGWTFPP